MVVKFQPVKTANSFYWLNAFLTKLTENDHLIKNLDADKIGGGLINFVFCFSIFGKIGILEESKIAPIRLRSALGFNYQLTI